MNSAQHRVRQVVSLAWEGAKTHTRKLSQNRQIKPDTFDEVFEISSVELNRIRVDMHPVVFNVPERAGAIDAKLFIAISGWVELEECGDGSPAGLRTYRFSTEVAYFRRKAEGLEHVYGAHFDMDEDRPGHPLFHMQLNPRPKFDDVVRKRFRVGNGETERGLKSVLKTVRVPVAQMDFFSLVAQLGADHLIGDETGGEAQQRFDELRQACDCFAGAAHRFVRLHSEPAARCYRGTRWYPCKT